MNLANLFNVDKIVDFEIDALLEDCLEEIEKSQNSYSWITKTPRIVLDSIKNGEIYNLWASDWGFAEIDLQLSADGDKTHVIGTAKYPLAPLLLIIFFSTFLFPAILLVYQVDFIVMLCPVFIFILMWYSLLGTRDGLIRRVRKILWRASRNKRWYEWLW